LNVHLFASLCLFLSASGAIKPKIILCKKNVLCETARTAPLVTAPPPMVGARVRRSEDRNWEIGSLRVRIRVCGALSKQQNIEFNFLVLVAL